MGLAEQAPDNKTILRLLQNPKVLVGYNAEVV
jgi:hypothetical protein